MYPAEQYSLCKINTPCEDVQLLENERVTSLGKNILRVGEKQLWGAAREWPVHGGDRLLHLQVGWCRDAVGALHGREMCRKQPGHLALRDWCRF